MASALKRKREFSVKRYFTRDSKFASLTEHNEKYCESVGHEIQMITPNVIPTRC